MKILLCVFLIATALSCTTRATAQEKEHQWLIDSLNTENFILNEQGGFPEGITPSLIRGYTNRVNGIFHLKELKLESLKITSLKFERKEELWTRNVQYYHFSFEDKQEEAQFERFQSLLLNYQAHSKNQVSFFKRNATWYLKFIPMP